MVLYFSVCLKNYTFLKYKTTLKHVLGGTIYTFSDEDLSSDSPVLMGVFQSSFVIVNINNVIQVNLVLNETN